MDAYRALICENISYDLLLQEKPYEQDLLDCYVELMVETCCTGRETIRVNQEDVSALYNAPVTIGQYYASQVAHDMAQGVMP